MNRHEASDPEKVAASQADFAGRVPHTRVVCLGLSALDLIWNVEALFAGGSEKIRGSDYGSAGGGMAANAAVAVARLGGSVAFWGRGGDDAAGHEMKAALTAQGVDTVQFRLFADGRSSVSGVLVDASGERQIVNFRGRFPEPADWLPLDQVSQMSAVLADPRWVAGAVALFEAARASGVPTVLDADIADPEVFEALLPLTDHAVFSEPALARFAGAADDRALKKVAGYGCRVAAVTRGDKGVSLRERDLTSHLPAFPVTAVDTTGAGDIFHGAYALAIGAGLGVADAMAFAGAAAALKCTRAGGRAGIPTLDDCLAFQRIKR